MLKYAKVAKVGDYIRAYDFKPMKGREDCFVEGVVLRTENKDFDCYVIEVTKDVFGEDGSLPKGKGSRVGQEVFVPFQVSFMEYDGRIMNLSE